MNCSIEPSLGLIYRLYDEQNWSIPEMIDEGKYEHRTSATYQNSELQNRQYEGGFIIEHGMCGPYTFFLM